MVILNLTELQSQVLLRMAYLAGDQAHDGEWKDDEEELNCDCEEIFEEIQRQLEGQLNELGKKRGKCNLLLEQNKKLVEKKDPLKALGGHKNCFGSS